MLAGVLCEFSHDRPGAEPRLSARGLRALRQSAGRDRRPGRLQAVRLGREGKDPRSVFQLRRQQTFCFSLPICIWHWSTVFKTRHPPTLHVIFEKISPSPCGLN